MPVDPSHAACTGPASLRASSSDVFPTPFSVELNTGCPPELASDSGNTAASAQSDLRVTVAPEDAAPRTGFAAPPTVVVREPLHVHIAADAPATETAAADDKGKKISHKRGRSLSSLVPRLIGRRASATGDELNVRGYLPVCDSY